MNEKGDIIGALESDDSLRRSLDEAGKTGSWADEAAVFFDARLAAIERDLQTRRSQTYTERRLEELQRKPVVAAPPLAVPKAPTQAPTVDAGAKAGKQVVTRPRQKAARAWLASFSHRLVTRLRPLLCCLRQVCVALLVFAPIAGMNALLTGSYTAPTVSALLASLLAGTAWWCFAAGRFRSMLSGALAYLLTFPAATGIENDLQLFAQSMGLLMAMLGSSIAGLIRERNRSR